MPNRDPVSAAPGSTPGLRLDLDRIDAVPRPVVGRASDYPDGHVIPPHRHGRGQLVYAARGVLTVRTPAGSWVAPPQRAVWVPAGLQHHHLCRGRVAMRTVFIAPGAEGDLGGQCAVFAVPPLVRELILRLVEMPDLYRTDGPDGRLVQVLLDQLQRLDVAPLHLPLPGDARARRVAAALLRDPADRRPLSAWSRSAGASSRTLSRLFVAETGMSFGAWRQQARLLAALPHLAAGAGVAETADRLGYASPSAFVAMFRRVLGQTPARYFRERR